MQDAAFLFLQDRREEKEMSLLLDVIVLAVILGCGAVAWQRGFIRAALGFLPMLAALIGTRFLSPFTSRFLRGTPLFGSLADSISNSMGLDHMISESAMQTQTEIIEGMKLPGFLKEALLENNNPVIYHLLDVEKLQDYIAGFLANICINILSVLLAFILIYIGTKIILNALHLFSKLPVLNLFNHFTGFLVGAAKGLFLVWMGCIILTFFQCSARFSGLFEALEVSYAAKFLYENNILLYLILKIFT